MNICMRLTVAICVVLLSGMALAAKPKIPLPSKDPVTIEGIQQASQKKVAQKKADYLSQLSTKVIDTEETELISFEPESQPIEESQIPIALNQEEKPKEAGLNPLHKMLAALCTLMLFALILFFFIHKAGRKGSMASGARNIKILSQKSIGPKRDLMVIKVAGESVLLGVTDQNINFIKNLSILDDEMPQVSPDGFSEELHKNLIPSAERPVAESEKVDGYAVSKLSDVRDVVSRRFQQ